MSSEPRKRKVSDIEIRATFTEGDGAAMRAVMMLLGDDPPAPADNSEIELSSEAVC